MEKDKRCRFRFRTSKVSYLTLVACCFVAAKQVPHTVLCQDGDNSVQLALPVDVGADGGPATVRLMALVATAPVNRGHLKLQRKLQRLGLQTSMSVLDFLALAPTASASVAVLVDQGLSAAGLTSNVLEAGLSRQRRHRLDPNLRHELLNVATAGPRALELLQKIRGKLFTAKRCNIQRALERKLATYLHATQCVFKSARRVHVSFDCSRVSQRKILLAAVCSSQDEVASWLPPQAMFLFLPGCAVRTRGSAGPTSVAGAVRAPRHFQTSRLAQRTVRANGFSCLDRTAHAVLDSGALTAYVLSLFACVSPVPTLLMARSFPTASWQNPKLPGHECHHCCLQLHWVMR